VVDQLLGVRLALTTDQTRYLDYLGNSNNVFDVGDFLAWVNKTGAPSAPAPGTARLRAVRGTGGRR